MASSASPAELEILKTWLVDDTPMDYADGTLVLLAEALNVHEVATLDRRGFSTYRTRRNRSLRLVLDLSRSPERWR